MLVSCSKLTIPGFKLAHLLFFDDFIKRKGSKKTRVEEGLYTIVNYVTILPFFTGNVFVFHNVHSVVLCRSGLQTSFSSNGYYHCRLISNLIKRGTIYMLISSKRVYAVLLSRVNSQHGDYVNTFIPSSNQHRTSPYNITSCSYMQVMGIKEMIPKVERPLC